MEFPVSSGHEHRMNEVSVLKVGDTNVHIRSELSSGPESSNEGVIKNMHQRPGKPMWIVNNQLKSAQPLNSGKGMQMLQKMGWKPGEGLGLYKTGSLQPLLPDIKLDKRGLISKEEHVSIPRQQNKPKPRPITAVMPPQILHNKHPVSLLNEVALKRNWSPPLYLCKITHEVGPPQNTTYEFSVTINGETFQPSEGACLKKEAKVIAARYCLQQMGILPQ